MYFDSNGLLGPTINEEYSENGVLFTLEYIMLAEELLNKKGSLDAETTHNYLMAKNKLSAAIMGSRNPEGYYAFPDSVHHMAPEDQFASHDNLTAMISHSYREDLGDTERIWKYNKFSRPGLDANGKSERVPLHPRDVIYYGALNGNVIARLFLPLFFIITLVSMVGDGTSGKLLSFVRVKTLRWTWTYGIITYMLRFTNTKTWRHVFAEYFKEPNHPNNILAAQIWKD